MQHLNTGLIVLSILITLIIYLLHRGFLNKMKGQLGREISNSIKPKFIDISLELKSLIDLAVDVWRLQERVNKDLDRFDKGNSDAIQSSIARIRRYLDKHDVEAMSLTGQVYNEGMNVEVVDWLNESGRMENALIVETIDPSVLSKGQLIKKANVKVKKG